MNIIFALLGASSGGSFLAVGAAANARLSKTLRSSIAAAMINFIVGFSTLSLLLILGLFGSQDLTKLSTVPLWAFWGGALGAIFVTLNTLLIPRLGLTPTTLAVVCSQMIVSLVVDHFGWFGVTSHPVNVSRIFAIGLLLIAIVLIQLDRK